MSTLIENDALDLARQVWGSPRSPSPMPQNIRRCDLASIDPKKYVCAPKTDGERVTIIMGATDSTDAEYIIAIDRSFRTKALITAEQPSTAASAPAKDMRLDRLRDLPGHRDAFCGSLLDAERLSDGSFVVFDAFAVAGYRVAEDSFLGRLKAASALVEGMNQAGLRASMKKWRPLSQILTAYEEPGPPKDGVIFMPLGSYTDRANPIWKWKAVHTLDFLFRGGNWWLGDGASLVPVEDLHIEVVTTSGTPLVDGSIYECAPNPIGERSLSFVVQQPRPDKTAPNNRLTVERTITSVVEAVGLEILAREINKT